MLKGKVVNMREHMLSLILSIVIFILFLLIWLIEPFLTYLGIAFVIVPFILFNKYRVKKSDYVNFYFNYFFILFCQGTVLFVVYQNIKFFASNLMGFITLCLMSGCFVGFILYFIQLYCHADKSQIITW
ncbi:hypothetical protein MSWAN_1075 [Methanobacterium paludis]|uniref:Uncharacterized protein n=1 Tax=Methanobacterium paludis (strain DSM 25820 / JCM 18151 / SWAN1) TaxID=868131 RepID=F6D497_METPW|nr:hypothetical protein MSWAN_1075 [Methanobacterium paludis]